MTSINPTVIFVDWLTNYYIYIFRTAIDNGINKPEMGRRQPYQHPPRATRHAAASKDKKEEFFWKNAKRRRETRITIVQNRIVCTILLLTLLKHEPS